MASSPEHAPSNGSIEGEFASETDKMRLAAVERIMDKGFPKEGDPDEGDPSNEAYPPKLYGQIWEQTDSYIAAAAKDASVNEELHNFLQDPDTAGELRNVLDQLKNGVSPDGLLHKQEQILQQNEDPLSWRKHLAFVAFENAVTGAIRNTNPDLVGPVGEAARRVIQVAEIMDAESNGTMVRYEDHRWMKGKEELYAADFEKFSKRADIPTIYRDRARDTASNLRIDAMKYEKKPESADKKIAEEIGFAEEPVAPAPEKPKTEYREAPRGVTVRLERDPSRKVFGKENPMTAEDIKGIQARLEVLTREGNTKNAREVVTIVANLERAGVRMGDGKGELGSYLQRQRGKILEQHGRGALAQYLTLGKYAGFFNELSDQENKVLREKVFEMAKKDGDHKGFARLCRNARYLGVSGYSAELVKPGIMAEIGRLQQEGDLDGAAREAAWARKAGVDPSEAFTASVQGDVKDRLVNHASAGRWEMWARLRSNVNDAWQHGTPTDKQVDGLLGHFGGVREQAKNNSLHWNEYTEYAATVSDMAKQDAPRKPWEKVEPKTAEVREHTILDRAKLTPEEYEAYLGGPEPARPAPAEEEIDFVEMPAEAAPEPVVPANIFSRIWSRFFGRRERKAETPTDTAA